MPKMLLETVAEALRATPPKIRGLLVEGRIDPLDHWVGEGNLRLFYFRGQQKPFSMIELMHISEMVSLSEEGGGFSRLHIVFRSKYVPCPGCGRRVKAGNPWWTHYNQHATRAFWINREHWSKLFDTPYQPPPD